MNTLWQPRFKDIVRERPAALVGNLMRYGGSSLVPGQTAKDGGIYVESGTVRNSIIYFNSAPSDANWYDPLLPVRPVIGGASFNHSCTTPDPGGVGNIVEDPQFVDRTNGDYHLAPTSPCIDAGANEPRMLGYRDLDDLGPDGARRGAPVGKPHRGQGRIKL